MNQLKLCFKTKDKIDLLKSLKVKNMFWSMKTFPEVFQKITFWSDTLGTKLLKNIHETLTKMVVPYYSRPNGVKWWYTVIND